MGVGGWGVGGGGGNTSHDLPEAMEVSVRFRAEVKGRVATPWGFPTCFKYPLCHIHSRHNEVVSTLTIAIVIKGRGGVKVKGFGEGGGGVDG